MDNRSENQELQDRLNLIEAMISEGRKKTESWGWSFVLWGLAYYVAIAWSTWGHSNLAWPVTMIGAALLTSLVAMKRTNRSAETTISRAMGAIWMAVGAALFIFCFCGSLGRHLDLQTFVSAVGVLLGTANAASSLILRWKAQFAAALVWFAAGATVPFVNDSRCQTIFLVAIFLAQIVFGVYMMFSEGRQRKEIARKSGPAHA